MKHPYSRKKRIDYKNTDFELIKDLTNQIIIKINPTPNTVNEYLKYLSETNSLNWVINNFDLIVDSWENYSNQNLNISDREKAYYTFYHNKFEELTEQFSKIIQDPKEKHHDIDYNTILTEQEKIKLWRFPKLNFPLINNLDSKEVIIVSIIIGAIIFLIFGYMFGEYYGKPGLLHFNFTLAISMFIISSGISYLILNKRIKK